MNSRRNLLMARAKISLLASAQRIRRLTTIRIITRSLIYQVSFPDYIRNVLHLPTMQKMLHSVNATLTKIKAYQQRRCLKSTLQRNLRLARAQRNRLFEQIQIELNMQNMRRSLRGEEISEPVPGPINEVEGLFEDLPPVKPPPSEAPTHKQIEEADPLFLQQVGGDPLKMKYCPDCWYNRDKMSSVQRYRLNDDTFMVHCVQCSFGEEHKGVPPLNPADVRAAGLPAKLCYYMEVYAEDVDKIIRLASQDFFLKYVVHGDPPTLDLCYLNQLREKMSTARHFDGSSLSPRLDIGQDVENILNSATEEILGIKVAFENLTEDITQEYKQKVKDCFGKIDDFIYPDDIFEDK